MSPSDPEFPVFVLTFCLFHKEEYITQIVPAFQRLKLKHFGHDMVIFHEREIRKQIGPFTIFIDRTKREALMADLNEWVEQSPFTIIAVVIRKTEFARKYSESTNAYHFAMQLGLERLNKYLERINQNGKTTHVVFESRGKREDAELELEFRRVCDGRNYTGARLPLVFVLAPKAINSTGLQLADLTARPIGRHVMNPEQTNRAYEIISKKLDRSGNGTVNGFGLKVYP